MSKGKKFENKILNELNQLSKKGLCFFIKSPTPIRTIPTSEGYKMVYSEKALCDFLGIWNGKFVIIEAKEISGQRFDFKRLKDHQVKQLSSIKRHGGFAYIFFNVKKFNEILVCKIEDYLIHLNQTNKKSINIDALREISICLDKGIEDLFNQLVN